MKQTFDEGTRGVQRLATVKVAGVSAASAHRINRLHAKRIAKTTRHYERNPRPVTSADAR